MNSVDLTISIKNNITGEEVKYNSSNFYWVVSVDEPNKKAEPINLNEAFKRYNKKYKSIFIIADPKMVKEETK